MERVFLSSSSFLLFQPSPYRYFLLGFIHTFFFIFINLESFSLLWKSDFSSFRILKIWLTVEPMVFFYDLFFVHKKTCIVRDRVLSECSESTRYTSFFSFCNLVSQYIVIKCFPECLKLLHLTFFRVLSPFFSSWSVSP